jgi:lysyl-tRNA synthetase class 1
MNEYNELEDIYFGRIKVDNQAKLIKSNGLFEYVNLLNPPKESSTHVNFRLLIELSKIFKEDRIQRVMKKLLDYGVIKNEQPEIEKLIELAGNFADEFDQQEKIEIDLDELAKKSLKELTNALNSEEEPEDIQNTIYQIAKSNDVQPKDFFRILYQIILGTSRGPKIGPFISDIGRKKVAKTISEYV